MADEDKEIKKAEKQAKEARGEKAEKAEKEEKKPAKVERRENIVRIAGMDVSGDLNILRALSQVKGLGQRMSVIIGVTACEQLGVPADTKVGSLQETQIDQIERMIAGAERMGLPNWLYNRQGEFASGATKHFVGADLVFDVRQNIEREKTLRSYRGTRHAFGQKVRGQHTRSTGRTGRTMGVAKQKLMPGKAAPGAAATPGAAPAKEEKAGKLTKAAKTAVAGPAAPAAPAKAEAKPAAGKKEEKR